jgi:acetyl-CoA C-acetyltransferase
VDSDQQPVIVGVGQATWREQDLARSPVDGLEHVARLAAESAGVSLAGAVDTIVHVPFISNQVPALAPLLPQRPGAALAERCGLRAQQFTADVGGNLPQQLVNEFAARLVRGEASGVLIAGAEMLATLIGAVRSGAGFPEWTAASGDAPVCITDTPEMTAPTEQAHGLYEPIHAYPLFESALRHALGLDAAAHGERLGGLVSRMSEVAAANPHAWKRQRLTQEEVLSTEGGNRMICHPYTKVMNSIIAVDQAAAVLLTTVGRARALGIDETRWVYLRGCADAQETWYLGERAQLHESPALRAAAVAALDQAGCGLADIELFDLYSCFPSAVQVACRALGLEIDDPRGLTVTGGMSLFGGPGNNYSLHAIATVCERLRGKGEGTAVVTANGGYLTKHSVGVYARQPGASPWTPCAGSALQVDAESPPRSLVEVADGEAVVVAHTVRYSRGEPVEGIVLGELEGGRRCVATSTDPATIEAFLSEDCVGRRGRVSPGEERNRFTL